MRISHMRFGLSADEAARTMALKLRLSAAEAACTLTLQVRHCLAAASPPQGSPKNCHRRNTMIRVIAALASACRQVREHLHHLDVQVKQSLGVTSGRRLPAADLGCHIAPPKHRKRVLCYMPTDAKAEVRSALIDMMVIKPCFEVAHATSAPSSDAAGLNQSLETNGLRQNGCGCDEDI